MKEYANLKTTFLNIYANLPLTVRQEIIYIDEEQRPGTWNVVWVEVSNNTAAGKKMLEYLHKLQII